MRWYLCASSVPPPVLPFRAYRGVVLCSDQILYHMRKNIFFAKHSSEKVKELFPDYTEYELDLFPCFLKLLAQVRNIINCIFISKTAYFHGRCLCHNPTASTFISVLAHIVEPRRNRTVVRRKKIHYCNYNATKLASATSPTAT